MLLDTGFRPSRDGFGFPNTWRDMLIGVVASRGRCGGMVFAALDSFTAGLPLDGAVSRDLPDNDTPLGRLIWQRQVDSVTTRLGSNLWQFVRFTYLPSASAPGIAAATRRELLPLFDALRSGRPVPLGLVSDIGLPHLARNHQVLAYAADFGEERVEVRIYDPNHPRRDDVTLEVPFATSGHVIEHIGAQTAEWRGFFIEHYRPCRVAAGI